MHRSRSPRQQLMPPPMPLLLSPLRPKTRRRQRWERTVTPTDLLVRPTVFPPCQPWAEADYSSGAASGLGPSGEIRKLNDIDVSDACSSNGRPFSTTRSSMLISSPPLALGLCLQTLRIPTRARPAAPSPDGRDGSQIHKQPNPSRQVRRRRVCGRHA